jgi:hypothetical protein
VSYRWPMQLRENRKALDAASTGSGAGNLQVFTPVGAAPCYRVSRSSCSQRLLVKKVYRARFPRGTELDIEARHLETDLFFEWGLKTRWRCGARLPNHHVMLPKEICRAQENKCPSHRGARMGQRWAGSCLPGNGQSDLRTPSLGPLRLQPRLACFGVPGPRPTSGNLTMARYRVRCEE